MPKPHQNMRPLGEKMKGPPARPAQTSYTDTHTFIIRIWQDGGGRKTSQPVWRGVIEQVGSDRHVYVFDGESITQFLQEQTGIPAHQDQGWLRGFLKWIRHEK